ncbi:hypothetical protein HID58_051888, partial [Brassica napus]
QNDIDHGLVHGFDHSFHEFQNLSSYFSYNTSHKLSMMSRFSRVYSDELEKQMRYTCLKRNFNKKGNTSYKLGINEFADSTNEEFIATHTGLSIRREQGLEE